MGLSMPNTTSDKNIFCHGTRRFCSVFRGLCPWPLNAGPPTEELLEREELRLLQVGHHAHNVFRGELEAQVSGDGQQLGSFQKVVLITSGVENFGNLVELGSSQPEELQILSVVRPVSLRRFN